MSWASWERTESVLEIFFEARRCALEHVVEVGVAADVELARALEAHPAVHEELGEDPVDDGGAHLRLDVVAHHGQAALLEAPPPVALARDEDRDAVDEAAARVEDLLHVPLGRHLAAHGQEVDHHVGARLAQDARDVGGGPGGLGDDLGEVVAEAVVGHAALDGHAETGDLGEAHGVVRLGSGWPRTGRARPCWRRCRRRPRTRCRPRGSRPSRGPHEARDEAVVGRVAIVLDPLDERGCAVADPDDGDANRSHDDPPVSVPFGDSRRRRWRAATMRPAEFNTARRDGRAGPPTSSPAWPCRSCSARPRR